MLNATLSKLIAWLSALLYALAILWLTDRHLTGHIDTDTFFNADALYLPSLFKNIFSEGKHISDWMLAPSSYVFPDALLFYFAYLTSKNAAIQILAYAIIQSLAFLAAAGTLLAHFLNRREAFAYSTLIASTIIFLGLYSPDPYGISFMSVFHFGGVLSYLLLSATFLAFVAATSSARRYLYSALAIALSALSVISDHLIALHFIAPVLLIAILAYLGKQDKKSLLHFSASLLAGAALALILEAFFFPNLGRLDYEVGLGSLSQKSLALANWIAGCPPLTKASLLLLPIALGLLVAIAARNRNNSDPRTIKQVWFAYLILTSFAATLLVSGLSSRAFTIRYLLPFVFLPPVFVFALLPNRQSNFLLAALLLISTFAFFYTPAGDAKPSSLDRETVRCIDTLATRHNLSRGIAWYWDAIPVNVFTRSGLQIAPVRTDTSPTNWMYNTRDYEDRFSFAIINNDPNDSQHTLLRDAIEKKLARKPREYVCKRNTLLVFENETITLPIRSELSHTQSSALESFVHNPRALLIMARERYAQGHMEDADRLLSEAITLLRQSGADEATIAQYESTFFNHHSPDLSRRPL